MTFEKLEAMCQIHTRIEVNGFVSVWVEIRNVRYHGNGNSIIEVDHFLEDDYQKSIIN